MLVSNAPQTTFISIAPVTESTHRRKGTWGSGLDASAACYTARLLLAIDVGNNRLALGAHPDAKYETRGGGGGEGDLTLGCLQR